MTQYVCDRCASVNKNPLICIEIPRHDNQYRYTQLEKRYELCLSCLNELNSFLEPLPQVKGPQ